ncbi:DUF5821 family protein [Halobaculum sp. MBLA0143]|uniref:transcriptional regulator TbsP domain-containing protein n=1 Tax=Halobaculum sp. MBLA0143 TaxID=3079933 RepID=UPI003525EC06
MPTIERHEVETFRELFDTAEGTLYAFDPPVQLLSSFVVAASRYDETTPPIRVLAGATTLRRFTRDFEAAATAAELSAEGRLSVRTDETTEGTTVFATAEAVFVPVIVGEADTAVAARRATFAADVFETCRHAWETRDPFRLTTPSLSTVRETLTTEFGRAAAADFEAALSTVTRAPDPTAFDPASVVVMIAARHEQLHYDVTRWGNEIGLASKATFSRKKTRLEELGVVTTDTESVPTGRPRQRLSLTEQYERRVEESGIDSLVAAVLY